MQRFWPHAPFQAFYFVNTCKPDRSRNRDKESLLLRLEQLQTSNDFPSYFVNCNLKGNEIVEVKTNLQLYKSTRCNQA